MKRGLKQISQFSDCPQNHHFDFMERWNQRLTLGNPNFCQRYLNQELWLLIHFRVGDSEEFVACFQSFLGGVSGNKPTDIIGEGECLAGVFPGPAISRFFPISKRLTSSGMNRGYGDQQLMLVEVVKFFESPEFVVPSFVWFDLVENVYNILPQVLYFSSKAGKLIVRGAVSNGEVHIPPIRKGRVSLDKVPNTVVEGASEIAENVPSDQRNFLWNGLDATKIVDELSRLRIVLTFDSVWMGFVESVTHSLEVTDVLAGPFNLCD